MKHSSLDSSHHDESNGGDFILLSAIDAEIFNEMSIIQQLTFTLLCHLTFCLNETMVNFKFSNEAILRKIHVNFSYHCLLKVYLLFK